MKIKFIFYAVCLHTGSLFTRSSFFQKLRISEYLSLRRITPQQMETKGDKTVTNKNKFSLVAEIKVQYR
jgi:hypothetical protein